MNRSFPVTFRTCAAFHFNKIGANVSGSQKKVMMKAAPERINAIQSAHLQDKLSVFPIQPLAIGPNTVPTYRQ
jgi:hypothetical protein